MSTWSRTPPATQADVRNVYSTTGTWELFVARVTSHAAHTTPTPGTPHGISRGANNLTVQSRKKESHSRTVTRLESGRPSVTVAQEKRCCPVPPPETEAVVINTFYFPKSPCPPGPTSSRARCRGSAREQVRFGTHRYDWRAGVGSLSQTPPGVGSGCRKGGLVDHLVHGGLLVPRACHDVLVIPRDVTAEHRG